MFLQCICTFFSELLFWFREPIPEFLCYWNVNYILFNLLKASPQVRPQQKQCAVQIHAYSDSIRSSVPLSAEASIVSSNNCICSLERWTRSCSNVRISGAAFSFLQARFRSSTSVAAPAMSAVSSCVQNDWEELLVGPEEEGVPSPFSIIAWVFVSANSSYAGLQLKFILEPPLSFQRSPQNWFDIYPNPWLENVELAGCRSRSYYPWNPKPKPGWLQ